jgi:hypothetical protein
MGVKNKKQGAEKISLTTVSHMRHPVSTGMTNKVTL